MSFVGDGQLEKIVQQLERIANSLEVMNKNFENVEEVRRKAAAQAQPVIAALEAIDGGQIDSWVKGAGAFIVAVALAFVICAVYVELAVMNQW